MSADFEDYKIVDRQGLTRALVYRHARSVEVRIPVTPYAAKTRWYDSMAALERWVNQRRWRIVKGAARQMLRAPRMRGSMTDEEFAQRYMITSLTGRIWNRTMVRRAAMDRVRTSPLPGLRDVPLGERAALVDSVLNDDAWMRRHAGMIPQRVIEAIEDRVWELVRGGA